MPGGWMVQDGTGFVVAYVYGRDGSAVKPGLMTLDEARRIAAGIARLPELLTRK